MVGADEPIAEDGLAGPLTRETLEAGGGEAANDHVDYRDLPLSRHHVTSRGALTVNEGRREGGRDTCVCE